MSKNIKYEVDSETKEMVKLAGAGIGAGLGLLFLVPIMLLWVPANIAMLVCGSLGLAEILDINMGGSIAMVVLGSIFGALPLISSIMSSGRG